MKSARQQQADGDRQHGGDRQPPPRRKDDHQSADRGADQGAHQRKPGDGGGQISGLSCRAGHW